MHLANINKKLLFMDFFQKKENTPQLNPQNPYINNVTPLVYVYLSNTWSELHISSPLFYHQNPSFSIISSPLYSQPIYTHIHTCSRDYIKAVDLYWRSAIDRRRLKISDSSFRRLYIMYLRFWLYWRRFDEQISDKVKAIEEVADWLW